MPINDHYLEDSEFGWASHNPGIIGGFSLILGLALGIALSQYWLQQDLKQQLAAVERDIKATHHPLNQLTGFKDATIRANTLLGRLENQSSMLYKAGQTVQQSERLNDQIARMSTKLDSVEVAARKLAKMESNLTHANAKLAVAEGRIRQLEELASRLNEDGADAYKAQEALAAIELTQQQLINQQCLMPELIATVDSQWRMQSAICDLAKQSDATGRAIELLADNQDRVQHLAVESEASQLVLGNVKHLLEDQQSMDLQVKKLADTLDAATALSYEAIRLNTVLNNVHRQTSSATQNMDELAWLVDYINSQDDKIATAQKTLRQIDDITVQVARLDDCVPGLVENVDLVKGLNKTMGAVLGSSMSLRTQLAEIVLMQPAVEQLASRFEQLTSPQPQTELASAKDRAKSMIEPEQELQIPVYISRAK
ncbi:hypothetical protein [Blastopirellula marina]|uniref:Uncharacterized protein n=1 Tax=Blastopirellula marina TaxID=124 RepID=A0A2S8GRK5_9BACT|nr:hypothetical protein [Blastopirellula marina]PQO47056.1 hypothetical protein C5Y93_06070 [Blastopirellula marina]